MPPGQIYIYRIKLKIFSAAAGCQWLEVVEILI